MKTRSGLLLLLCTSGLIGGPAYGGPPFRTDDPEPVEYQHWEVYQFSAATHAQGDTAGVLPGLEVNYGAAPDLQLHVVAPLAFAKPSGSGIRLGYGDTEFGVKYRFIEEDEEGWRPQVAVFPFVEAPSGNAHRGLGAGHTREFLPLWVQKSFGDWTTYGGGGYWINPGAGNRNFFFSGWLLQRKITDTFTLGRRDLLSDPQHDPWEGQQRLQYQRDIQSFREPSPAVFRRARNTQCKQYQHVLLLHDASCHVLVVFDPFHGCVLLY